MTNRMKYNYVKKLSSKQRKGNPLRLEINRQTETGMESRPANANEGHWGDIRRVWVLTSRDWACHAHGEQELRYQAHINGKLKLRIRHKNNF